MCLTLGDVELLVLMHGEPTNRSSGLLFRLNGEVCVLKNEEINGIPAQFKNNGGG